LVEKGKGLDDDDIFFGRSGYVFGFVDGVIGDIEVVCSSSSYKGGLDLSFPGPAVESWKFLVRVLV
jgi:hypothetical protein